MGCAHCNKPPRVPGMPCAGCNGPPRLTGVGCHPVKFVLGASGDALRRLHRAPGAHSGGLRRPQLALAAHGAALRLLNRSAAAGGGASRPRRWPETHKTTESPGLRGDHLDRTAAAGRAALGGFQRGALRAGARRCHAPREACALPPLAGVARGRGGPWPRGSGGGPPPASPTQKCRTSTTTSKTRKPPAQGLPKPAGSPPHAVDSDPQVSRPPAKRIECTEHQSEIDPQQTPERA
jgi:hypothetical protein